MSHLALADTTINISDDNRPKCEDVLSKCDAALNAQVTLSKLKDDVITEQTKKSVLQDQIIADKDKELGSWYRNPVEVGALTAIVIITLELATGALHGR